MTARLANGVREHAAQLHAHAHPGDVEGVEPRLQELVVGQGVVLVTGKKVDLSGERRGRPCAACSARRGAVLAQGPAASPPRMDPCCRQSSTGNCTSNQKLRTVHARPHVALLWCSRLHALLHWGAAGAGIASRAAGARQHSHLVDVDDIAEVRV
jgi:hypothetical protein